MLTDQQQKLTQRAPSPNPFLHLKAYFSVLEDKAKPTEPNNSKLIIAKIPGVSFSQHHTSNSLQINRAASSNANKEELVGKSMNAIREDKSFLQMTQNGQKTRPVMVRSLQDVEEKPKNDVLLTQRLENKAYSRQLSSKRDTSMNGALNDALHMNKNPRDLASQQHKTNSGAPTSHKNGCSVLIQQPKVMSTVASSALSTPVNKFEPKFTKSSSISIDTKQRSCSTSLMEFPAVKQANVANPSIDLQNRENMGQGTSPEKTKCPGKTVRMTPFLNGHSNNVIKQTKEPMSLPEVGTRKQLQKYENSRFLQEVKKPAGEKYRKDIRAATKEDRVDAYQLVKQDSNKKQTKAGSDHTLSNNQSLKCSTRGNGLVKAYAAATNQGTVRDYNEDRVTVLHKINPPPERAYENWPKCSFFAVFDGHGGSKCAEYLRDHLHELVIGDPAFPKDPVTALGRAIDAAEDEFLALAEQSPSGEIDRSGSCAIIALIVGNACYIANVGDSRAILSSDRGANVSALSNDHKPMESEEQCRIVAAGGHIYQSKRHTSTSDPIEQEIIRPYRVYPGRLSVSRTIGDIQAKLPKYGGNPNCIIATPEIKTYQLTQDCDFIVLASDGVFDVLSNEEVSAAVWNAFNNIPLADSIHKEVGIGAEAVLKEALNKGTFDNVTAIVIAFENLSDKLFPKANWQTNKENKESKLLRTSNSFRATMLKELSEKRVMQGFIKVNQATLQKYPQGQKEGSVKDKKYSITELYPEKTGSKRGFGSKANSLNDFGESKTENKNRQSSLRKDLGDDEYLLSQAITKSKPTQKAGNSNPVSLNELPEDFVN